MKIRKIFREDIYRNIEGVIKADDDSNLLEEVKEYVITKEIGKKLELFLEEYLNYKNANGVWISGFFGSGKSHLLKIISLVLQNKKINGYQIGDLFLDKISDEIFQANFRKAISIPSKSILFNIDQKADITSKQQPDAILSVFIKVFNEMRGYYPKHGYLAKFESDLERQGIYEKFKEQFAIISGESWETGREEILLEIENFGKTLSAVKGMSFDEAVKVIDKYESNYKTSIEEFAKDVKEYIDKQEKGFRLNFFVDEIGQYISDNTKLMLNLQTIAETLATKCKGQAWIIVTSQQDINSVIGEMTDQQANDFSRIQARFKTTLNLTSANVDEVIQKRLLSKNDDVKKELFDLYEKEKNNIKALTDFRDGSRTYKSFTDEEHFQFSYPLLPYQFDLFQASIRGLSKHNAFQGKHQSVGERSMLSVFQTVVQKISEKNIGELATYDMMFEGLRGTLRGEIQSSILVAERNLENDFSVKVLKVLFMVKYVKEFKASSKNIAILLLDNFEMDTIKHEKNIKEALNILEQDSYVQRSGDIYEFLTDEEKDIEQEIKSTNIETSDAGNLLADIAFKEIIRDSKIRYEVNKNDYSFALKMDDTLLGQDKPLSINIFTPLNDRSIDDSTLRANSMGKNEILVKLPNDSQLTGDLYLYKKTEKYIQQTHSNNLDENKRQILNSKGQLNTERRRNLIAKIENMLSAAKIFMNGTELDINNNNPKTKIYLAFQELIKFAYPNINMLNTIYKEEDLKNYLLNKNDDLFINDDTSLSEAEIEIFQFINRNKHAGERTTTKALIEKFSAVPYGWQQIGILVILAKIYLRGKVEIKLDSNILDEKGVYDVLSNNRHYTNTIIEPQQEFDDRKVRKLKDLHLAFFNEANSGKDPKEVALEFKEKLAEELITLEKLQIQKQQYPFLKDLDSALELIKKLKSQDYPYFLNAVDKFEDDLLNAKENFIDNIKRFMNSTQKEIYDELVNFNDKEKDNFEYITNDQLTAITAVKENPTPYKGNIIQLAKQSFENVKQNLQLKVKEEIEKAINSVEKTKAKIESFKGFDELTEDQKDKVVLPFEEGIFTLESQTLIHSIKVKSEAINKKYEKQAALIEVFLNENNGNTEVEVKKIFEPVNNIKIQFPKNVLETEQDVDDYVNEIKSEYLKIIKDSKRILL